MPHSADTKRRELRFSLLLWTVIPQGSSFAFVLYSAFSLLTVALPNAARIACATRIGAARAKAVPRTTAAALRSHHVAQRNYDDERDDSKNSHFLHLQLQHTRRRRAPPAAVRIVSECKCNQIIIMCCITGAGPSITPAFHAASPSESRRRRRLAPALAFRAWTARAALARASESQTARTAFQRPLRVAPASQPVARCLAARDRRAMWAACQVLARKPRCRARSRVNSSQQGATGGGSYPSDVSCCPRSAISVP
jgi:hypothetical protein